MLRLSTLNMDAETAGSACIGGEAVGLELTRALATGLAIDGKRCCCEITSAVLLSVEDIADLAGAHPSWSGRLIVEPGHHARDGSQAIGQLS
jgi:hypothetical protein